jgi:rsbT co-antagonist protein RsbR
MEDGNIVAVSVGAERAADGCAPDQRPAQGESTPPVCVGAEQMLRTLVETISMVVTVIEANGIISYMEGSGLRATGVSRDDYIGRNSFELAKDRPESLEYLKRALRGGQSHYTTDRNNILWESWILPAHDEQGQICGAIAITLDKSETKRAMQELQSKLEVIERQQEVIRNLETPIIEIWERVLTLPMIGVVDSSRASRVTEHLLAAVARTSARYAILDLTGVEMVDTATASHLIDMVRAIRLLGAEGMITGIRPTVAQTIVTLGVDLSGIITCGSLREGLKLCIRKLAAEKNSQQAA